jgi:hypothetical protein
VKPFMKIVTVGKNAIVRRDRAGLRGTRSQPAGEERRLIGLMH